MRGRCSVSTNSPPVKSRPGSESRIATWSGKTMLAVHVLMQAIVVAGAIAQQERRRPRLTRRMAAGAERLVLGGVADVDAHRRVPAVGERREPPIEAATERDDQVRQRIGEIFVLAPAEAVARHHDARAEAARRPHRAPPSSRQSSARQQLRRDRAAVSVELALDRRPVEGVDSGHALIRPFGPPSPEGEGVRAGLPSPSGRGLG